MKDLLFVRKECSVEVVKTLGIVSMKKNKKKKIILI